MVNYLAGSNEAPEGFPGMAHAQEHMMFRGSPGLSANQLATLITALGGMFNADTQQAVTQYFFTVPAADLEVALASGSHAACAACWTVKSSGPRSGAPSSRRWPRICPIRSTCFIPNCWRPCSRGRPMPTSPLGTDASFDKTTGAMLQQFYDAWYAPNNAIVVIAGDVDPQKTLCR